MKHRCNVYIKGGIGRPCYDGIVEVYSNEDHPDFHDLVFSELKRSSFPEIWRNDVVVNEIKKINY